MANYRYCIYCHTNKINGMKYVGCTHLNPLHRWQKDGNGYEKHTVFADDIEKYGWENFTHEILEYGIIGKNIAFEKEREYINRLNAIWPNGYNKEDGGIHGSTNPNKPHKEKRPKTGWHHTEETREKMRDAIKNSETHSMEQRVHHSKPVDMFSKDGEHLNRFYGAAEASRQTGVDMGQICKVCKDQTGRYKTAGGYIWKYVND